MTAFFAVGGGPSPQSSSISRSRETNSFACRSRIARTSRSFSLPSATGSPSSTTSSGPRIRYSTETFYRFPSQKGSARGQVCLSGCARASYPAPATSRAWLARSNRRHRRRRLPWRGLDRRARLRDREVPAGAGRLLPPIEYELRDLEPSSSARVTAQLEDGRFTIATDQPHVKVAWRIRGQRPTRPNRRK